jgi:hypothetical protein
MKTPPTHQQHLTATKIVDSASSVFQWRRHKNMAVEFLKSPKDDEVAVPYKHQSPRGNKSRKTLVFSQVD